MGCGCSGTPAAQTTWIVVFPDGSEKTYASQYEARKAVEGTPGSASRQT